MKAELRKHAQAALNQMAEVDRRNESKRICDHLAQWSKHWSGRQGTRPQLGVFVPFLQEPYLLDWVLATQSTANFWYPAFPPEVSREGTAKSSAGPTLKPDKFVWREGILPEGVSADPQTMGKGWEKSVFGFFQPGGSSKTSSDAGSVKPVELDFILVPGLAFDRQGARLGRGKGHYDRVLVDQASAVLIGIGFDCQLQLKIPQDKWDISLSYLVTGSGWIPTHPGLPPFPLQNKS